VAAALTGSGFSSLSISNLEKGNPANLDKE
jgi:hypothetical protein